MHRGIIVSLLIVANALAQLASTTTGLVTSNKTLTLNVTNTYSSYTQVVIDQSVHFIFPNNHTDDANPITFHTVFHNPRTKQTSHIEDQYDQSGNLITQPDCSVLLGNNSTISWEASFDSDHINPNASSQSNVSVTISLYDASLPEGTHVDKATTCPGHRFFYFSVPDDGFAYNLTLQASPGQFSNVFDVVYLKKITDQCDIGSNNYDQVLTNTAPISTPDGYTFPYLVGGGGRWILWAKCINSSIPIANVWQVNTVVTQTCTVKCLERGTCMTDAPQPYCRCTYLYTGMDCMEFYSGFYVYMAVASVTVLLIALAIAFKLYRWHQTRTAIAQDQVPLITPVGRLRRDSKVLFA